MPGHFFDAAYEGRPPWDIGRPQPAFERLLREGAIVGSVLDVGTGTGEHPLLFAASGHDAWGVDIVPRAIELARAKAKERGSAARFVVGDALALGALGRKFDTATDSGCYHTFEDDEREQYVESLAQALRPGGRVHVLCFSEREPGMGGPRRVTQAELRASFAGWREVRIAPETFTHRISPQESAAQAWLATFERATR